MARLFDDASTEYLKIDSATVSAVPFSVSLWVKRDADVECVPFSIVDKDSNVHSFAIQCLVAADSNYIRAFARDAGGYGIAVTTTGLTNNVWQHILAVFAANDDRRVYLNGGGKGTNATSRTPANMDRTAIGYWGIATPSNYFSGDIAEVGVWNTALTDEDALVLAAGFSPKAVQSSNLISYWPLIRGLNDGVGGYNLTASGTAVSAHPRIILPSTPIIIGRLGNITTEPSVLSLELDLLTPTVIIKVLPEVFVLELNLPTPTVGIVFQASALALELDVLTPTIYYDVAVNPDALSLELDLLVPTVNYVISVSPDVLELELDLLTPTVDYVISVSPAVLALELSLAIPRVGVPFPTLSASPRFEGFVDEYSDETVVVDTYASGYPLINPQFTFNPKFFSYDLNFVSQADKDSFMTFYESNKSNNVFWLNEQDDNTYLVIFTDRPNCELDGANDEWKIEADLKQVVI